MRVYCLLLLAGFLVCTGAVSAAKSRAGSDPRSMVLRLSDLPKGVLAGPARYYTNAQAAVRDGVRPSAYARHGRVVSYQTAFSRDPSSTALLHGPLRVDDEVTEYATSADAHWGFLLTQRLLRRGGVAGATTGGTHSGLAYYRFPYRPLAAQRIGNEAAAFTADSSGDEFEYTTRALVFREGRYVVRLRVVNFQDKSPVATAVALARVIERRVAAAG